MNQEPSFSRRDILKSAGGAGVGLAAGIAGTHVLENRNGVETNRRMNEASVPDSPNDIGRLSEMAYESVSRIAYFEVRSRVGKVIEANKDNIIFDRETGKLRVLNEADKEIAALPGERPIVGVYVSTDNFSITFEYKGKDGSNFGIRLGRGMENRQLTATTWDTNLGSSALQFRPNSE